MPLFCSTCKESFKDIALCEAHFLKCSKKSIDKLRANTPESYRLNDTRSDVDKETNDSPSLMCDDDHVQDSYTLYTSDLETRDFLQPLGLRLNNRLSCLCCISCGIFLTTSNASNHLRNKHPGLLSSAEKRHFAENCAKEGVIAEFPAIPASAVAYSGISLYTNALLCGFEGCDHIASTRASMKTHHHQNHRPHACPGAWSMLNAQRFDRSQNNRLFRVQPPPQMACSTAPLEWLDALERKISNTVKHVSLNSTDHRDMTQWQQTCGWPEHVGNHDPEFLRSLVRLPLPNEFPWLQDAVFSYFEMCTELTEITSNPVRLNLNTDDPNEKVNHQPFGIPKLQSETFATYVKEAVKLLAFLLRDRGRYKLDLPRSVTDCLSRLRSIKADTTKETKFILVHEVLLKLWTQPWPKSFDNTLGDPTLCYLALSSIKKDHSWMPPHLVTPLFARFRRLIRYCLVFECHVEGVRAVVDRYPDLKRWHYEGEDSTFATISSLQHIASRISYSTMNAADVVWQGRPGEKMLYKGATITLDGLRKMGRSLHAKSFKSFSDNVLLGHKLRVEYDTIHDDRSDNSPGHGFLDDPRNVDLLRPRLLYSTIMDDPVLKEKFVCGWDEAKQEPIFNHIRLREWLNDYGNFHTSMLASLEFMSGAPSRGTELSAVTFRNTAMRLRNVMALDKTLIYNTQYSKTNAVTGLEKLLPHGIDAFTADMIIQDLLIARPFAELVVSILFPNNSQLLKDFHTYLFMKTDRHVTTNDLSAELKEAALSTIGSDLTIRPLRQIMIAYRRALDDSFDRLVNLDGEDTVGSLQAGHNRDNEDRLYGISSDFLLGTPDNLIQRFIECSKEWQINLEIPIAGTIAPYTSIAEPGAYERLRYVAQKAQCPLVQSLQNMIDGHNPMKCSCCSGQTASNSDLQPSKVNGPVSEEIVPVNLNNVTPPVNISTSSTVISHVPKIEEETPDLSNFLFPLSSPIDPQIKTSKKGKEKMPVTVPNTIDLTLSPEPVTTIDSDIPDDISVDDDRCCSPYSYDRHYCHLGDLNKRQDGFKALSTMRSLLNKPDASWSCAEQRESIVEAIEHRNDFITILPTGGGKTMVALVPAMLERTKITVIVVPLRSLLLDYQRRLEAMDVPYLLYKNSTKHISGKVRVVLVTTDLAATKEFSQLIQATHTQFPISRFFFDEGHVTVTSKEYRPIMDLVYAVRSTSSQVIVASATIPHSMVEHVKQDFGMPPTARIIRKSTNRSELSYRLEEPCASVHAVAQKTAQILASEQLGFEPEDRALVFVPRLKDGEFISKTLKCDFYNGSGELNDSDRQAMHKRWLSGVNKVMVCTEAFGAGNDFAHVRLVIHAGTPKEMLNFLQEVGRAARDGKPAKCFILPVDTIAPSLRSGDIDLQGKKALYEALFRSRMCLRHLFTSFVDGKLAVKCTSHDGYQLCSRCLFGNDSSMSELTKDTSKVTVRAPSRTLKLVQQALEDPQTSHRHTPPSRPPSFKDFPIATSSSPPSPSSLFVNPVVSNRVVLSASSSNSSKVVLSQPPVWQSSQSTSSQHSRKRALEENNFEQSATNAKRRKTSQELLDHQYMSRLDSAFTLVGHLCTSCLVQGAVSSDHMGNNCPQLEWRKYSEWRNGIRSFGSRHCRWCCFPMQRPLHPWFDTTPKESSGQCTQRDCVVPLMYVLWNSPVLRAEAETFFSATWVNANQFKAWLNCPTPVPGYSSNILALFLWFVEYKVESE